jgi:protein-S-isoprenylcysteine O-methyltransferase Ste14
MTTQRLLLAYIVLYFCTAFVWSSWRAYRKTGQNPIVLPSTDDVYGYVARAFKLLMVLLLVYTVSLNVIEGLSAQSGALTGLTFAGQGVVGCILLLLGFALTLKAQIDMGASWRIGIDTQRATQLVTQGLFSRSRNPIYLSMRLALLGQFVCLPTAVTLVFLALGEVLMQIQVRLEEAHLTQQNGDAYRLYQSTVPRWF